MGPFGEELKVKVEEKLPKQFDSTKALLFSFPGAGSERLRALLEQATGKVGFTSSIVQDNDGIDSNFLGEILGHRPKESTTDHEVVVVDIQLGGARIQDEKKKRRTSLEKYHYTTDEESRRPIYFSWKAGKWTEASFKNLVKQWRSTDSVFTLIETTSQQLDNVPYS